MMDPNLIIKVKMADLNVAKSPGILTTLGLGSCVGIALYDPVAKIGGLAHIMLPDSTQIKNNSNIAKFADTATVKLIEDMINIGARKDRIVAKLAGGAQMFSFSQSSDLMRVGARNVAASQAILTKLGIPIIASDTGENYGRTVELYTEDGRLVIKTIGHGIKQI
ncbi:MAG: chemotaxis protein CheD [Epulopiscium sp.]|jgi:chemotaxis protein CheD|uniref:chemotaxis protein CheD n=1 Tax=Defluviitalea raffinosedens TaxID=1450156 RepID=UPI001D8D5063|nr:chemotaxis protein CheD [Defluviitalea raffinosedens]MBZ4669258.1 chemotaxis protein [Defluviitaleaceae bacterium]MDK2787173.1 chemotaxis protein CheD [Candidatus Epulonipiscium sp.]